MFDKVTLEMSLKPFKRTDETYIRRVCVNLLDQWKRLLKNRKIISIMLWTGDGSEILDFSGNMNDSFEWGRFIGTANRPYRTENEPLETSLHLRKQDYIENPPVMTYQILKRIVSFLKEEGHKAFPDAEIRVGETFDIGPEFAISDFKYNRHREITSGEKLDSFGFVDSTARLNRDSRCYAAYPNGLEQGTPFGTFLGKQSEAFLSAMGFDYLWLSNGLGFSASPWSATGKIFDGKQFYTERLAETGKKVFEFWHLFRKECHFPIETRGTNHSVGIDYATDGVPLYDIYRSNLDITAPPNSPWAALNGNYGLELMGYMSRLSELPSPVFPFRYYIHDPWWVNSPWYDRYGGSPCDIYLPMAVSRINENGIPETANSFNLLSIDNSYGNMPDSCVDEPLPHILKAEKEAPDDFPPLIWVYPLREYTTADDEPTLREMYLGDRYICAAINEGFPLCCVTSTDSFLKHAYEIYSKSILVTPVPKSHKVKRKLAECLKKGIPVMAYGTTETLSTFDSGPNLFKVNVEDAPENLRHILSKLGYHIEFIKKRKDIPSPVLTISKYDHADMYSIYTPNTTTVIKLKMPLGAPILLGMETEMVDGFSHYTFSRGERRECRVFVEQKQGIISCREMPPVNARFRRAIKVSGLEEATVYLFGEKGAEVAVSLSTPDETPKFDKRFKKVMAPKRGLCLRGEHISGDILFLMGKKN